MSQTTFDRDDVAQKLNDHFIAIKIDRDFPDIDQIYMAATQLLTQHGGWPNSIFCLPTGQPFFAGTYFPADDRPNGPGFLTLLDQLSTAWNQQRDQLLQALECERVIKNEYLGERLIASFKMREMYHAFIAQLGKRFDSAYAGFGSAPKFPPYSSLRILIADGTKSSIQMVKQR